jgi:hypothetical protein
MMNEAEEKLKIRLDVSDIRTFNVRSQIGDTKIGSFQLSAAVSMWMVQ